MNAPAKDSAGSAHLDMLRGVAALTVFLGHLRALMFVNYQDVIHKGAVMRAVYSGLGLGHQAVIFFFVLSGFLVGGGVRSKLIANRFSVRSYISARLTRLYAALIPALVIGVVLDIVGSRFIGTPAYSAGFADTVPLTFPASIGPTVFAGNLLFLQTLWVPIVGTNAPLWSLPCEFWYYAVFPCLLIACSSRFRPIARFTSAAVAICILTLLARPVVPLFGVWLLGAVVSTFPALRFHWTASALAGVVVVVALGYGRFSHSSLGSDYILGVAAAASVYLAAASTSIRVRPSYRNISRYLSSMSYTLYLGHFPAVVLISAWWLHGVAIQPDRRGMAIGLAAAAGIFSYCCLLWHLGERHTDALRRMAEYWTGRRIGPPVIEHAVVTAATPVGVAVPSLLADAD